MSFTIKNGTPVSSDPLYYSCKWVHMQRGFRQSEEVVFCNYGDLRRIPFPVRECSDYRNRTHPSWDEMEELALPVDNTTSYKPAGFRTEALADSKKD